MSHNRKYCYGPNLIFDLLKQWRYSGFTGNTTDKPLKARFYNLSVVCYGRKKLVFLKARCFIRLSFVTALPSFLFQEIVAWFISSLLHQEVVAWFVIASKKVCSLYQTWRDLGQERKCMLNKMIWRKMSFHNNRFNLNLSKFYLL